LHLRSAVLDVQGVFILAYRTGVMLSNFATLNLLILRKLAKRYEQTLSEFQVGVNDGEGFGSGNVDRVDDSVDHREDSEEGPWLDRCGWLEEQVFAKSALFKSTVARDTCDMLAGLYATQFEGGSQEGALAVLQAQMTDLTLTHSDTFRLGLKAGVACCLVSIPSVFLASSVCFLLLRVLRG
jgi:hypothetical protein